MVVLRLQILCKVLFTYPVTYFGVKSQRRQKIDKNHYRVIVPRYFPLYNLNFGNCMFECLKVTSNTTIYF